MNRIGPWLLVLGLAIALYAAGRSQAIQEARAAAAEAELRAALRFAERRSDSLAKALRPQLVEVERWRTRWDTLPARRDTLRLRDTVWVPVEVLVVADSTIRACSVALDSCQALVASVSAERDRWRDLQRVTERMKQRPWLSAGVAYDPLSGRLGAYVDRDLWRLRFGATVIPEDGGAQLQLRAGWRW